MTENLDTADKIGRVEEADSGHSDTPRSRWHGFSDYELATIGGALSDSSALRSDNGWYLRCHQLFQEVILQLHPEMRSWAPRSTTIEDTAPPPVSSETPELSSGLQVHKQVLLQIIEAVRQLNHIPNTVRVDLDALKGMLL